MSDASPDPLAADRARTASLDGMGLQAVLDLAQDMTRERISLAPGVAVYDVVDRQLSHMQAVLHVGTPVEADVDRMTIGTIAVKNFEDVDPEYARVLLRAARLFREA